MVSTSVVSLAASIIILVPFSFRLCCQLSDLLITTYTHISELYQVLSDDEWVVERFNTKQELVTYLINSREELIRAILDLENVPLIRETLMREAGHSMELPMTEEARVFMCSIPWPQYMRFHLKIVEIIFTFFSNYQLFINNIGWSFWPNQFLGLLQTIIGGLELEREWVIHGSGNESTLLETGYKFINLIEVLLDRLL